jgi:hypothetical protein
VADGADQAVVDFLQTLIAMSQQKFVSLKRRLREKIAKNIWGSML